MRDTKSNALGQEGVTTVFATETAIPAWRQLYLPNPETVIGRVLGCLLRGETLTQADCYRRFASSRLGHHIFALGQKGWQIARADVVVTTRDDGRLATIREYWLTPSVLLGAGERGENYGRLTLQVERRRSGG